MELIIKNPNDVVISNIEWNHEEIKNEVSAKVEHYKTLVYTDDQIGDAKKDKATLNKFITALEDKRKEVKKQCLAPYETFEKQVKEITGLVQESVNAIDTQVKAFDEQKKARKLEDIQRLYDALGFQDFVTLEKIFNPKWLNASVSIKSIDEELKKKLLQIGNDVYTISKLPEFGFEAMQLYKKDLNLNSAIEKAREMSEISKAKAEATSSKTEQVEPVTEEPPIMVTPKEEPKQEGPREWVSFKCLLTVEDARALGQFFKSRNISFEQI